MRFKAALDFVTQRHVEKLELERMKTQADFQHFITRLCSLPSRFIFRRKQFPN
jgi:hypothetical protein